MAEDLREQKSFPQPLCVRPVLAQKQWQRPGPVCGWHLALEVKWMYDGLLLS